MKYKNIKTGVIYDDILQVWQNFKCPCLCQDCSLDSLGQCNESWILENPVSAAEIMGYQIIDYEKDKLDLIKKLEMIVHSWNLYLHLEPPNNKLSIKDVAALLSLKEKIEVQYFNKDSSELYDYLEVFFNKGK